MNLELTDLIGWIGAAGLLSAYLLLSIGKLTAAMRRYHLLNLVGGIGLGINTFANHSYPATLVNMLWTSVAIYSLVMIFRKSAGNIQRG
jgi:hypothetical protein